MQRFSYDDICLEEYIGLINKLNRACRLQTNHVLRILKGMMGLHTNDQFGYFKIISVQ